MRKRPPHISRKKWAEMKLSARGLRNHGVLLEDASAPCTEKGFLRQRRVYLRNVARIEQSYIDHPGAYRGKGEYQKLTPEQLQDIERERAEWQAKYEAEAAARNA
jgi:hypothetical protein